jgi:dipeptidase
MPCTTIIIGRALTTDGSVLVAHNEDLEGNPCQHVVAVPAARTSPNPDLELYSGGCVVRPHPAHGYLGTSVFDEGYVPGGLVGGVNDCQLAIFSNMAHTREYPEDPQEVVTNGVMWSEFMQLVLDQCDNARAAVELIGSLAERHGLSADPGTMFAVADPGEGWWVEVARGGQWAAERVPDDAAVMRANAFRIGQVPPNDPRCFRCSPDVVSHAESKGWFAVADGVPFEFARAYGDPDMDGRPSNVVREQEVRRLLKEIGAQVSLVDLMAIMRSHYEGTQHSPSAACAPSPHDYGYPEDEFGVYTICRDCTNVSFVAQLRDWLPPEVGAVLWMSMKTPCLSPYVPWYSGTDEIPIEYRSGTAEHTPDSAYWAFDDLVGMTDRSYPHLAPRVQSARRELEERLLAQQNTIEQEAARLGAAGVAPARRYLTRHTAEAALEAYESARALLAEATRI